MAAVIPNWNGARVLTAALASLRKQTVRAAEIVVVDNGSTDGSDTEAESSGARVVRLGANLGFSAAVNRGIAECRSEWIAVLNNDTELEPDWLETLLRAANDPALSFATGKLLDARRPELIDGTFDALSRGACAWRCGRGRADGPAWDRARAIWSAPFTAALFRRAAFDQVGLLDERFESYLEDVDWGLRCAGLGVHGVYEPKARARHWGSATLGRWHCDTVRRISRNQVYLVAKHFPTGWGRQMGWPVFCGQSLWGLIALRHGAGWAWLRGKAQGIANYRAMRGEGRDITRHLAEQEQLIRDLQTETGFDWYWRIYFALVGSEPRS